MKQMIVDIVHDFLFGWWDITRFNVGGIISVGNFLWGDMNVINIKFDILGYSYTLFVWVI